MWRNQGSAKLRNAIVAATAVLALFILMPSQATATSQWSRKTGIDCGGCHTLFPRLNSFGEQYLRNGYTLQPSHTREGESEEAKERSGFQLDRLDHLLGFRLNVTAVQLETHSLLTDSTQARGNRWTLGNPNWIQFFVAGNVQEHLSFFSELEYSQSAFKFNWFYWNVNRLGNTPAVNFQVGNISPLEFASFPNRLPQLPAVKGEVFLVKSSNGVGEASVDMSSARPGIQYFGHSDWLLGYAGVSPGPKATQVNQFFNTWAGAVVKLPEGMGGKLEGSTATLHYYTGVDTKSTGAPAGGQITNRFTRLSPQLNIRYDERLDLQAAYVMGRDDNRDLLLAPPPDDFEYAGVAFEGGYMPNENWHIGAHYDNFESDNEFTTGPAAGKPIIEFHRIVPAVTYVLNQNIRGSLYWEHDLTDKASDIKIERVYFNVRAMF